MITKNYFAKKDKARFLKMLTFRSYVTLKTYNIDSFRALELPVVISIIDDNLYNIELI